MSSEELQQRVRSLEFKLDRAKDEAHLKTLRDRVSRLDRDISGLQSRLAKLRSRGYAFGKSLEEQAKTVQDKWQAAHQDLQRAITRVASRLKARLPALESRLLRLKRAGVQPTTIAQAEEALEDFSNEIRNAEAEIQAMYSGVESLFTTLNSELRQIEQMLDHLEVASFSLLAGESGIRACKAVWARSGDEEQKDDPEGILYLTDQRLLFEQKEKVATKKVLFIATEKKLVQELLFEAPVAAVEEVREFSKGMLGKDDYLAVQFSNQAPQGRAVFHIWGVPADWIGDIQRARSKGFDADRAIPLDEDILDRVREAPSECPSCGATLNQPVLRGQDTLNCAYCGYVIRL